jgi:hypothetical protein
MKYNVNKLWISKYKKFIDKFQQDEVFYSKGRENVILIKDINGLHHPLKILSLSEVADFYKKCKDIDITSEFIKDENGVNVENPNYKYHQVYAMPNPSEDLNWLSTECINAATEFKAETEWWQHPYFIYAVTGFICFLMITITLIFRNRV